ncbi:MAG: 4-deoxy-4-formamido-L-arabinose-phosphoundecaprenol deformylase [Pontiellaceae bacterium]|nr:4-deoxy-4-formamido-L-arabinose-phosphoundecaprenol deformylase [Pontiellaceae bacterium]MBN2786271.1 4-deoxy-4-formamido-L-arabinose-phosphoundecaprenol deformylase [Pontiellaceae bacterium]
MKSTSKLGLRIDVDTYRGTRLGVPALCDTLKKHDVKGTFFFSVGPDNMGRHLWRLLKPDFFIKMLRSNAASLYGWDILLRGTFFPGPIIGKKCAEEIRRAGNEGHEIGLHAWDHHAWQAKIDRLDGEALHRHIDQGFQLLREICGKDPVCSAAPGWKANEETLLQKEHFPFAYNSDCRGDSIFMPSIGGKILTKPQIPVTLPTYDEAIGRDGITNENYNEHILSLIRPDRLNVLTIHAEVEGIVCNTMFDDFLAKAAEQNIEIVPCGQLIEPSLPVPEGKVIQREIPGREGWLAHQG